MKYMLMFCGSMDDQTRWDALSEEERAEQYRRVGAWFAEHGSRFVSSAQLQSPDTATTVRFQPNGTPTVTDGPFIEGREVIGGFVVADVAHLDEALDMAKTWPGGATVEVRPVMEEPR